MDDIGKISDAWDRYLKACHAMQSGVASEMGIDSRTAATDPKHLRVGINTALTDLISLARLLLDKGVFTSLELAEVMATGMEAEVWRYEVRLSAHFGRPVTLA